MTFMWWLSFIAHLLIIIVNWIIKKPLQFFIVLIVLISGLFGIITISKVVVSNNNLDLVRDLSLCKNYEEVLEWKKYAILRIDDIQSYYLRDIAKKMIDEWFKRNIPFTLGVIPMNFNEDIDIVNYLSSRSCNLEFALHWYNHRNDFLEFENISEIVASDKIKLWVEILEKVSDRKIITFIPPENKYSKESSIAIEKEWLKIVSSEWDSFFDYSASTYNYTNKWLNSTQSIIEKCNISVKEKGFCVIMLHPQDFIDDKWEFDEVKYSTYLDLIDTLEKQDYNFTTISDYYSFISKKNPDVKFFDYKIKKVDNLGIKRDTIKEEVLFSTGSGSCIEYPSHKDIEASVFWVWEWADAENGFIHNDASAWDEKWSENFVKNNENKYYFALPYNDLDEIWKTKENATKVYWYTESEKSILHDKWIKVTKWDKVAYAQWKDVWPNEHDDVDYVFWDSPSKNTFWLKAWVDLSPDLAKEIWLDWSWKVDWEFVSDSCIPDWKWKEYWINK